MRMHCEIRFGGHLDPAWAEWFDGLAIGHLAIGETTLRGELADQEALYGTLAKLRDLGLALIAVCAVPDAPDPPPPTPDR